MAEATQIPFAQLGYELIALLLTESRVAAKLTEVLPHDTQPLPECVEAPLPYEGHYCIDRICAQQLSPAGEEPLRFRVFVRLQVQLSLLFFAFEEQYDILAEPHFDVDISVHRPLTLRFTPAPVSAADIPLDIQPVGNLFSFAQGQLAEFGPWFLAEQVNDLIRSHPGGIELDLLPLLEQADLPEPSTPAPRPVA